MSRLRLLCSVLVCLSIGISMIGCAGEVVQNNADPANGPDSAGTRAQRRIVVDRTPSMDVEHDETGITLEITGHTTRALSLLISNNSGYSIRYGNGYELTGNQWGYAGEADSMFYDLPSGEQNTSNASVYEIGFGEFRLTKNITIDPENPANAKVYELVAEFAIDNTSITPELRGVTMEVDADFATSIGAILDVTNGFDNGRIYFDKSFWLERYSGDTWEVVPAIGSDSFLYDTHSLAARQILKITVYWDWLYGELLPGKYRIGKSFLHCADDGEDTQYDLYAIFNLDGNPVPDTVKKEDGSGWGHPLSGVGTLRAEVTELLDSDFHLNSYGNIGLLVSGLTPVWNETRTGDRFYVFDHFNLVVLDSSGNHMEFSEIELGAIVDITHSGSFLTSDPAIIAGTYLIKVVE